jgi:hypothetical protein
MKLIVNKGARSTGTSLDKTVDALGGLLATEGFNTGFVEDTATRALLSLESADSVLIGNLETKLGNLSSSLEAFVNDAKLTTFKSAEKGVTPDISHAGIMAAQFAAGLTGNPRAYMGRELVGQNMVSNEEMTVIQPRGGNVSFKRNTGTLDLQAFDERDNRTTSLYSVAYNLNAAMQDEFGETLFPTITLQPDQVGLVVSVRLMEVFNAFKRETSGRMDNFNRKNLLKAFIDPTILHNDANKIVPVYRDENQANFVAQADILPRNIFLDGQTIPTSPLLIGKAFSLLGLSQTDALLENGKMDQTDAIDPSVALKAIYAKVTVGANKDVLKFNVERTSTSQFVPAQQGVHRLMNLAFSSTSLTLTKDTKTVANAALTALAPIFTNQYVVRVSAKVFGSVNLETAETELNASPKLTVTAIYDQDGTALSLTAAPGSTIVALFDNSQIIGYDLDCQRTNSNLRQLDQLVSTTFYNQMYTVGLHNPISIQRTATSDGSTDTSDLSTLITTTRVRTSNMAVDELFRADAVLAEYVKNPVPENMPEVLGVGRFLLNRPYYEFVALNVNTVIASLSSIDRPDAIRAVLLNQIRDSTFRMYRDTGYKVAADAMAGGVAPTPTVIVATDPIIARYILVSGDTRTIGADFNIKIVQTLNERMSGKIFLTFGDFNSANNNVPNPLHFGSMAWKPELTIIIPLTRQGSTHKHISVTPSFQHIVHLPALTRIDVTGIPDAATKLVPINFHTIP